MSPHRITKKEMKQDRFVTYSLQVSQWIQKHLNEVLMAAGGVVLVTAVLFFIFSSQAKRERKAAELLGKANFALQSGDMGGAVQDLQTVVNKYGSTRSAGQAAFYLAYAYFYAKDYVQAQSLFEKYVQKYKDDPLLSASAQAGIGDCHMQTGNPVMAAENFLKAASLSPQTFLTPQYLRRAASAYMQADEKDRAREILHRLIAEYPDSREAHRAKVDLAQIAG
ncbi:MAG: tetratricopeptide repeat protein [Candidatus Zixiibacteriota bacterium]|nr:MAG: tetratricopeptide repeat protein [candidate division Zixibacteria bacterium]